MKVVDSMTEGGWPPDDSKENPQVAQIAPRSWDEITTSPPDWGWQPAPAIPPQNNPDSIPIPGSNPTFPTRPRYEVPSVPVQPVPGSGARVPDWGYDPNPNRPPVTRPEALPPWTPQPQRPQEPPSPNLPVPGGRYLPRLDPIGRVIIPTLHRDQSSSEKDSTAYAPDSPEADIYAKSHDAIAQVFVEIKGADGVIQGANGSGFFVTEDGKLATAYHVVEHADKIMVKLGDKQYQARVISHKPGSDISVLQVEGAEGQRFAHLDLAQSTDHLKSGNTVYAVGHPHGWPNLYLSAGKVDELSNVRDQEFNYSNPNRMLVVSDIHIEKGNSGSPLLDDQGKVVGVVNFGSSVKASSAVIEDLRSAMGQSSWRDYFPSGFYTGDTTWRQGSFTAIGAMQLPAALAHSTSTLSRLSSRLAGGVLFATGAYDLMQWDQKYFRDAWQNGSTAEKISSTINVGGDLSMMFGSAAMMLSGGRLRAVGTVAATLGIGAKFANTLFTDRTY